MKRLPSHGMRDGSPPKLHGQDTVQLQLSATVAVSCQFATCAREGTTSMSDAMATASVNRMQTSPTGPPTRGLCAMGCPDGGLAYATCRPIASSCHAATSWHRESRRACVPAPAAATCVYSDGCRSLVPTAGDRRDSSDP